MRAPTADARGAARPFDGDGVDGPRCDLGAYETGALADVGVTVAVDRPVARPGEQVAPDRCRLERRAGRCPGVVVTIPVPPTIGVPVGGVQGACAPGPPIACDPARSPPGRRRP
ncbi:MAG: hypothetical protein R3C15_08465 [Thermoleophilia bacterium]